MGTENGNELRVLHSVHRRKCQKVLDWKWCQDISIFCLKAHVGLVSIFVTLHVSHFL